MSEITVKSDQNIFDIAIIAYQDASKAYELIASNSKIDGVNYNITGLTLQYTESKVTQKQIIKTITVAQKTVIANSLQTLFDLSLQYYGSADKVYDLIINNKIENIHSDPTGLNLKYTIQNTFVPLYFRKNGKNIATKPIYPTEITETFYRVTDDFIVRGTDQLDNRIID